MGAGDEHVGVKARLTLTRNQHRMEGRDNSEDEKPGGEPDPAELVLPAPVRKRRGRSGIQVGNSSSDIFTIADARGANGWRRGVQGRHHSASLMRRIRWSQRAPLKLLGGSHRARYVGRR